MRYVNRQIASQFQSVDTEFWPNYQLQKVVDTSLECSHLVRVEK